MKTGYCFGFQKAVAFDVQIGVSGGWINKIPILHFRWKIMCNAENIIALHFVAENNYVVSDLASFDDSKMKAFLLKSSEKVNLEPGTRLKQTGNLFVNGSLPDTVISNYRKEFLQALKAR